MSTTKKSVLTGLCVALGLVLPVLFHSIQNVGSIFLPMYIPVFLCGLICGWQYGMICGVLTPVLSFLITGMPPAAMLPSMIAELAVYGLVCGLLVTVIKTKNKAVNLELSIILAMLCGRIISGLLKYFLFSAGNYSLGVWLTTSFVTCLPGIAILLILVPILVLALQKAKVIA